MKLILLMIKNKGNVLVTMSKVGKCNMKLNILNKLIHLSNPGVIILTISSLILTSGCATTIDNSQWGGVV